MPRHPNRGQFLREFTAMAEIKGLSSVQETRQLQKAEKRDVTPVKQATDPEESVVSGVRPDVGTLDSAKQIADNLLSAAAEGDSSKLLEAQGNLDEARIMDLLSDD